MFRREAGLFVNERFTVENFRSFMHNGYDGSEHDRNKPRGVYDNIASSCPMAQFCRHVSGFDRVLVGFFHVQSGTADSAYDYLPDWGRAVVHAYTGNPKMGVEEIVQVAEEVYARGIVDRAEKDILELSKEKDLVIA